MDVICSRDLYLTLPLTININRFPWWPCIVENDPDFESFFYIERKKGSEDTIIQFHVTFFGKGATRAWINEDMLKV